MDKTTTNFVMIVIGINSNRSVPQFGEIIAFLYSDPHYNRYSIHNINYKLLVQFSAHKSLKVKLADFDDWGQSTRRLDGGE